MIDNTSLVQAVRTGATCEDCLFRRALGGGAINHCRRFPPVYLQLCGEAAYVWSYPPINPAVDFCGEWTPKGATP